MASENTEGVIELRQPIFRCGVTTVRQESVGLKQSGWTDETVRVPPEGRATRRTARTQDAFIQPIQLRTLFGSLQAFDSRCRRGVLQVGLYLLVLCVEKTHIDHQVTNNRKPWQWPYHQLVSFHRLRQRRDTSETVFAVHIQTIRPTDAFATTPAVGNAAVVLRLNELQHVQYHQILAVRLDREILHERRVIGFGVIAVEADL